MIQRLLLLVVAPAACLLLAAYLIADDARREAQQADSIARLAELTARTVALDAALGAETVAGANNFETQRLLAVSEATDHELQAFIDHVETSAISNDQIIHGIDAITETLRYRDDILAGIISPLQISDRYGAARDALRSSVAAEALRVSPHRRTTDLSTLLAFVNASSAQVDERLSVELALRYRTWAPGQLAVVVGAIERQRLYLNEAATLSPPLALIPDAELERVRAALLTSAELPQLERQVWVALNDAWSLRLNAATERHANDVATRARHASADAERSFRITALAGLLVLAGALALATRVTRRRRQELADLEYRADFDALTGLANRARSIRELEMFCRSAKANAPPAILFLDLDGFKTINDRHGHDRGDDALRDVASGIIDAVGASNYAVGRLGGDEFVVAMPETRTHGDLVDLAAKLRTAILAVPTPDNLGLDVSIGGAIHQPGQSHLELLVAADTAMYESKGTPDRLRMAGSARESHHTLSTAPAATTAARAATGVAHVQ